MSQGTQGHKMTFAQEMTFPWMKTSCPKIRKIMSFPKIRTGQGENVISQDQGQDVISQNQDRKITSFPKIGEKTSFPKIGKRLTQRIIRHFPKADSSYDSKPTLDVREK